LRCEVRLGFLFSLLDLGLFPSLLFRLVQAGRGSGQRRRGTRAVSIPVTLSFFLLFLGVFIVNIFRPLSVIVPVFLSVPVPLALLTTVTRVNPIPRSAAVSSISAVAGARTAPLATAKPQPRARTVAALNSGSRGAGSVAVVTMSRAAAVSLVVGSGRPGGSAAALSLHTVISLLPLFLIDILLAHIPSVIAPVVSAVVTTS